MSAINTGRVNHRFLYQDTYAVVCSKVRGREASLDEITGGPTDPATGVQDHAADRHR